MAADGSLATTIVVLAATLMLLLPVGHRMGKKLGLMVGKCHHVGRTSCLACHQLWDMEAGAVS